jgi:hypothetical protein
LTSMLEENPKKLSEMTEKLVWAKSPSASGGNWLAAFDGTSLHLPIHPVNGVNKLTIHQLTTSWS